jgi:hypothetical protein
VCLIYSTITSFPRYRNSNNDDDGSGGDGTDDGSGGDGTDDDGNGGGGTGGDDDSSGSNTVTNEDSANNDNNGNPYEDFLIGQVRTMTLQLNHSF